MRRAARPALRRRRLRLTPLLLRRSGAENGQDRLDPEPAVPCGAADARAQNESGAERPTASAPAARGRAHGRAEAAAVMVAVPQQRAGALTL